jgi:hypothetical protein
MAVDDRGAWRGASGSARLMTFQELADEAFADVLKKHGRPVDLRAALRKSAHSVDAPVKGRAKDRKAAKH